MKTYLIYDDIYLKHNAEGHPEHKGRLESIMEHFKRSELRDRIPIEKPVRAKIEDIGKVHDYQYIQEIKEFCEGGGGYLDPDTYANSYTYEVSLYAVGGVIKGIDLIKEEKAEAVFCAVRPPGHHAEYSRAMGFCIFNNIAVGARYAQKLGYEKVFIVDFDAHHGNGTQRCFYEDDTVFYFSTHQFPFYPGTGSEAERGRGKGEGYTLNIPMPAYSGDKEYEKAYKTILPEAVKRFSPDIMLISAGYDLHEEDPLTMLQVTDKGIELIVESLLSVCKEINIPVLFSLEGGYNLNALGRNVVSTLRICYEY